jgi:hypothetical protein
MMIASEDLLILYNSGLDFIPYFQEKGINVKRIYKRSFLPSRVFRRIFEFLKWSESYWYADWKSQLPSVKTVIVFANLHSKVLKYINKRNKNIRIIYWYWDPVFRVGPAKKWMRNIAEIWSFDPEDCIRYDIKFNTTFYFTNISLPKNNIQYDVFFIGNDKGRVEYLQELEGKFNKLGVKGYYHVIAERIEKGKKQLKRISYLAYLEIVSKSKVLIDVLPIGQSGLTIRVMESIFLKKKLITNDHSIINHDFYSKDNIFILGKDNENELLQFVNSPYRELEDAIVKRYEVSNWLERFKI